MRLNRLMLLVSVASLVLAPVAADAATSLSPTKAAAAATSTRYVDVAVATIWVKAESARPRVDDLAISKPAQPRKWVDSMTNQQKNDLVPLMETQGLYGARVTVDETKTVGGVTWDHVWVDQQPTPRDKAHYGGYPGWVPDRQLTNKRPSTLGKPVRITTKTAWAYRTPIAAASRDADGRLTEFSYNTSFRILSRGTGWAFAKDNHGKTLFFNPADLKRAPTGTPRGEDIVKEARKFLGLPYLWSGTSGFGFDCSGFSNQIYNSFGLTIPRDAEPQFDAGGGKIPTGSITGTRIKKMADLRPGDIVGFRNSEGDLHHVGIYSGVKNGHPMMIDSPDTGSVVREEPLDTKHRLDEFAGATRFIHG